MIDMLRGRTTANLTRPDFAAVLAVGGAMFLADGSAFAQGQGSGGEGGGSGGDTISYGSIGGSTGTEHFVHDIRGCWGVDGKVLRH